MEARLKTVLPQEGTGTTGESFSESNSGSPTVSGGGIISPTSLATSASNTSNKKLIQQAFHPSLFISRPRSSSLGSNPVPVQDNLTQNKTVIFNAVENEDSAPCPPSWQRVPTNRNSKKRKMLSSPSPDRVKTSNRFSGLPIDLTDTEPKTRTQSKPPPIVLYGVEDVNKLTELLETVAKKDEFAYKIVSRNQLRINALDIEIYKKLISIVRENGLIGHTFNRKDNRYLRIVIRNLHPTTPINCIKEEIEATGNTVAGEIINARFGPKKLPTSTFFVNLVAGPNNKAAKDLKYIYHQSITIEDPRKRKSIVQCQRCQQYGHTKNYCMRPYRCVKCGQSHKTSECLKKDRSTPAQCALCSGPHPANYKGCEVYTEILARRERTTISRKPETQVNFRSLEETNRPTPLNNDLNQEVCNNEHKVKKTYAETLKVNTLTTNPQQIGLEAIDMILKQTEKLEVILQQMSTLMSLITKIVDKLTK